MMRAPFAFSPAFLLMVGVAGAALASLPKVDPVKEAAPRLDPAPASAPARASAPAGLEEEVRSLARRGLLDSALELCRKALQADTGNLFARFMAGKLAPGGKASADHFQKVLDAGNPGPELEESRFRLGQYHYAAGKYYLAIPCFRDYLRLHPKGDWKEPALYWMGRACMAFAQGRPDRTAYLDTGLVYFRKLLDLSPPERYYHALALAGMAKVKLLQGDWQGAWQNAQGALAAAPEDERASILLLAAQLRRGVDREEERRLLSRLALEHPQSPEVRHLRRLNGTAEPSKWRAPAPATRPPSAPDSAGARPTADSAPEVTAKVPPAAGDYTLQLGAFAQSANAEALVAELSKQGFAPEVAARSRGGKTLYQVRLGRFPSAEAAEAYARQHLKPKKLLSQPVPVR